MVRINALVYDPFLWSGERAGMRGRRSTLLRGAVGRVVEIGAGTGLNLEHYPDGLAELVLAEPEPAMRRRLGRFAGGCRCNRPTVELIRARGFEVAAENVAWRGMPPIVRPLMLGRATRAAAALS